MAGLEDLLPTRSFFFPGQEPGSPQASLALREQIARELMKSKNRGYPKNVGEGLTAIGDAIGEMGMARQLQQMDAAAYGQAEQLRGAGPVAQAPAQPVQTAYAPPNQVPDSTVAAAPENVPVSTRGLEPRDQADYNELDAQADFKHKTPGYMVDAINNATDNPDLRAYLGSLVGAEAPRGAHEVSPTGAAGPFQFTRSTGAKYGLVTPQGDMRHDLDASTRAAMQLTKDNASAFMRINNRPPTMAELALMHQQGGVTGARMAAGIGNAPSHNLAVNNVAPNANPAQAVSAINNYYGMPNRVMPTDNRDRVANAVNAQQQAQAQPTAQAVPQLNPTLQGAPTPPPVPGGQPSEAMAFSGTPTAAAGLPPEIASGRSPPAPPPQQVIRQAPPQQQIAQAPAPMTPDQIARMPVPAGRPDYVMPGLRNPDQPPMTPQSPREQYLQEMIARNPWNPRLQEVFAAELADLKAQRLYQDAQNKSLYEKQLEVGGDLQRRRAEQIQEQAQREQAYRKSEQDIIQTTPAPGATMPTGAYDQRLGTPQSPQRTGVPAVPAGVSPSMFAPKALEAQQAVQKATPEFQRSLQLISQLRNHPGQQYGLGLAGEVAGRYPGSQALDFRTRMDQVNAKAFLQAYATLKGGGSITEIEGSKATAAISRLMGASSPKAFRDALKDLEDTMRSDMELAQRRVNMPVTAYASPRQPFAPDIGQVQEGHRYNGGDPNNPANWSKL